MEFAGPLQHATACTVMPMRRTQLIPSPAISHQLSCQTRYERHEPMAVPQVVVAIFGIAASQVLAESLSISADFRHRCLFIHVLDKDRMSGTLVISIATDRFLATITQLRRNAHPG